MKKIVLAVLIALAICLSVAFFSDDTVAYAEANPTIPSEAVAQEDITVYKSLSSNEYAMFTIAATYYFKIVDDSDDHNLYISTDDLPESYQCYIKKADADKFTTALTEQDKEPRGSFAVAATLKADSTMYTLRPASFAETTVLATNTDIKFLGFSKYTPSGGSELDVAFVQVSSNYGFINVSNLKIGETDLSDYEIPLHPNYLPAVNDNPNGGVTEPTNAKLTRAILIIGIVIPALIIMVLLFKPNKKDNRYDYDRNRGYDASASPYDRPRSRYRDDYYDDDRAMRPRDDRDDYYDDRRR